MLSASFVWHQAFSSTCKPYCNEVREIKANNPMSVQTNYRVHSLVGLGVIKQSSTKPGTQETTALISKGVTQLFDLHKPLPSQQDTL